jgi:hypothetical protein
MADYQISTNDMSTMGDQSEAQPDVRDKARPIGQPSRLGKRIDNAIYPVGAGGWVGGCVSPG